MKFKNKFWIMLLAVVLAVSMFAMTACKDPDDGDDDVTITLSASKVELTMGDAAVTVTATVTGTEEAVTWSTSGDDCVTLAKNNNTVSITAKSVGSATLKAAIGDVEKTIPITVAAATPAVVTITLDKNKVELKMGDDAVEVTATVTGTEQTVTWSKTGDDCVILTPNGNKVSVAPKAVGSATLKANIGTVEKTINVTVAAADEGGDAVIISLSLAKVELKMGDDAVTVTATVTGSQEIVEWSATGDCVTLTDNEDNTVSVEAKAVGTGKLTAKIGTVEKSIDIEVAAADIVTPTVTITLSLDKIELKMGDAAVTVTATVNGSNKTVAWSATGECVNLTPNGNTVSVEANAVGTGKLTAKIDEEAEASIDITVEAADEVEVPEITLTNIEAYGYENGVTVWFKALFSSELINKDTTTMELAITKNGVSVNSTATNLFNAEVQVQINGTQYDDVVINFTFKEGDTVVATAKLEYTGKKELVLSETELEIQVDKTGEVSIVKLNGSDNLVGKTITWTIDDTSVATIPADSNGTSVTVTAVAKGNTTLTCNVDGIEKTCDITVIEGEVVEKQPDDVSEKLFQQEIYNGLNINIGLNCDATYASQLDISKEGVEVTATADGKKADIVIHEVYGGGPVYIKMGVSEDWTHTYVFTINYKNAAGKVIATGTFTREGDRSLKLSKSSISLELGVTETETITATVSGKVDGEIQWTVEGDSECIEINVSQDNKSVTVTAKKKGQATIVASIDGLTANCAVNVLEEGETPTVPTVTHARINNVYGSNDHVGVILEVSDPLSSKYAEIKEKLAYVKVNGVKNNDMHDMFAFGAAGDYCVNVWMGGTVQTGTDYVFELCDAAGNVLLKTLALQWNG